LLALLEFPILFLGATPKQTPALYSLMNYAGLKLGTFYPIGGFAKLTEAMQQVAMKQGVNFHTNHNVEKINVQNSFAKSLTTNKGSFEFDNLIGSADYEHIENKLLDNSTRNYSAKYWDKKVFAPSCLLFYLGINKKVDNLLHHTLFFNESLDQHADEIYTNKKWPTKPLFYVCCPSKTDNTVAPIGKENLFVLMPIATGLKDTEEIRERYFDLLLSKLEKYTGTDIINNIEYKRSYCINDFKADYNSYQGNAYGLANTLMQTANLKPKMKSKKVKNMFYAGQLTVPGPGVPPSIISGQVAAEQILKSQSIPV
jgi:phytoene desaturase